MERERALEDFDLVVSLARRWAGLDGRVGGPVRVDLGTEVGERSRVVERGNPLSVLISAQTESKFLSRCDLVGADLVGRCQAGNKRLACQLQRLLLKKLQSRDVLLYLSNIQSLNASNRELRGLVSGLESLKLVDVSLDFGVVAGRSTHHREASDWWNRRSSCWRRVFDGHLGLLFCI